MVLFSSPIDMDWDSLILYETWKGKMETEKEKRESQIL